ncbi:hypothetical protein AB8Z38_16685 [Bradyrhizobium sp. LLZ17]|uniref:Uncharacterized protein n=1 Tax=Bradyrhizobium sp. LLZ17 TaxID=3239388 RepID=A0AB39XTL3_9BRAD
MDVIEQVNASELPPVLHKSSRRFSWSLALVAVSIALCAGVAYCWSNIETAFATLSAHEPVPVPSLSPEDRETLSEIRSGQRQAIEEMAELNRSIGAQQADLTRMADQIEALTANIVSLQNLPLAMTVPPTPPPPAPHPVLRPVKRVIQPPKPEGPVSVGGVPLAPE